MEVVFGALPSLLPKLGDLLTSEYNLQKKVKEGIKFLHDELEGMKAALDDLSKIPADQLPSGEKIWARKVRELSYDIEDNIDIFMVQVKGHQPLDKEHVFKKFIEMILRFPSRYKIRRNIAINIEDIKSRVTEVNDQHKRYKVDYSVDKPVEVDLRALVRYEKITELVGIEESRDKVINTLMKRNEVSKQQDKIVSLVGFGGLGKTTLANVVYEKLRSQFNCSAFVSVSQTPHMDTLLKDMFYQLANDKTASNNVIGELRGFLQGKRYLVIIDDIWKILHWKVIRYALPDDNDEYRIITTTRISTVANEIGGPYKMMPLSHDNSRILMYGRIFGKEDKDKCPDEQLEEVSNRILKKCDGVPLAIITISSMLVSKGRSKLEWYEVCNAIGAGLVEENNAIENMRKVLSLSYYDMPSHLRTCMLYLSMFPEDHEISKDRLIWLWIAEGFIQYGKQEKSLFKIGESYFNELINRSMIQPSHSKQSGMIVSCHVHDMVLDLIRSLSREENFVIIQNNVHHPSASEKVRRLSLQNGKASHGEPEATLSKEHPVRSAFVFPSAIDYIPMVLERFNILRVLDLEGYYHLQVYSFKYLCNLRHLRYLGLRSEVIQQLPEEIGNLQSLQILDVGAKYGNASASLPSSIVQLTKLLCLRINGWGIVPEGIGSLIALEELSGLLSNDCNKGKILEELAHLTELKVLNLEIMLKFSLNNQSLIVDCLNKLQKIQSLVITAPNGECNLDGWVVTAPQNLRRLQLSGPWFARLPSWLKVDPSLLLSLSFLQTRVKQLQQEDLEILGRLPALKNLSVYVDHEDLGMNGRFVVGACLFPCLMHCKLWGFGGHVVFEQGAMPQLMDLEFDFPAQWEREIDSSFNIGLGNLLSLQEVNFKFLGTSRYPLLGISPMRLKKERAAVMHATIDLHQGVRRNHPKVYIIHGSTRYPVTID